MEEWIFVGNSLQDLKNIYLFTVYYEVVDPVFTKNGTTWISATQCTLCELDGKYFMEMQEDSSLVTYWHIDTSAKEKIVEFLEDDFLIENSSVESIIEGWGIEDFDREQFGSSYYENAKMKDKKEEKVIHNDLKANLMLQESDNVTYADIAAVAKNQRIDKVSVQDGSYLYEIDDLHAIVEFINSEHMGEWESVSEIPEQAEQKCIFIRSAAHKRTSDETLYEMYRHVLYQDENDYYVDYIFPQSLINENYMNEHNFFKIPPEVGAYLCNYGS